MTVSLSPAEPTGPIAVRRGSGVIAGLLCCTPPVGSHQLRGVRCAEHVHQPTRCACTESPSESREPVSICWSGVAMSVCKPAPPNLRPQIIMHREMETMELRRMRVQNGCAHSTEMRSSVAVHRHLGFACSQFSAGARKEPSALKITSRQEFHIQRVFLSHAISSSVTPLGADFALLAPLPSPSTMHSLSNENHADDGPKQRRARASSAPRYLSISVPSGQEAFAVQPLAAADST